jgi:hypothetical protein
VFIDIDFLKLKDFLKIFFIMVKYKCFKKFVKINILIFNILYIIRNFIVKLMQISFYAPKSLIRNSRIINIFFFNQVLFFHKINYGSSKKREVVKNLYFAFFNLNRVLNHYLLSNFFRAAHFFAPFSKFFLTIIHLKCKIKFSLFHHQIIVFSIRNVVINQQIFLLLFY